MPAGKASAQMTPPAVKKHLYSDTANPRADIAAALKQARAEHKRVILDFGVVHVDIGRMDRNVDVAQKYNVPIKKGVPALAVLDAKGKLLYSQENKEFENMRNMNSGSVTEFLNKWKA